MTHIELLWIECCCFEIDVIIIKDNVFIIQLDFVVSRCQIESCQWVMYDESSQFILSWWHANLNWFEVLSFSWKFRFFWSLFGLFKGRFLLCWWFRPLIGPLTHPIDARLLPGKVEKHRKGWITIEKEWIAERCPAVNCKKSHVVVR